MMLLLILILIIASILLGFFFHTAKQPSNPRKLLKACAFSGLAFIAAIQIIQATYEGKQSIAEQSPLIFFMGMGVAIVICFFLGWSYAGIRQEKKI
ncbi:hypothetical protein [Pseudomonas fragi]|uniref:hypothetical protein n=1 Tax=Pseudomonas fragi TaxID=296 RepID=UPI00037EEAD4|nr:hypothetical protein [Pseudomonas fragi]MDE4515191.1 hypothetical protein [Pseudomonas fragi]QPC37602.1 hypothetical protein IS178_10660 [Pseudomonas fragi]SDU13808.1 hypothetical protein SAMN05216594_1014 [Pseudomonas fragi]